MEEFKKNREEHQRFKEKRKREKLFNFEIVKEFETLHNKISLSKDNKRVPLILSSKSYYTNLKELKENLKKSSEGELDLLEFDLRQFSKWKGTGRSLKAFKELKGNLARLLAKGGLLVINIDDSDVEYSELYDPDLREFYRADCFPSQILERENLKIYEVFKKVVADTEFSSCNKLNREFKVKFS